MLLLRRVQLSPLESAWAARIDDVLGSHSQDLRLVDLSAELCHLDVVTYRASAHGRLVSELLLMKAVASLKPASREALLLMAIGDAEPEVTEDEVSSLLESQSTGYSKTVSYLRTSDIETMADRLDRVITSKLALSEEDPYGSPPGPVAPQGQARDRV